jgi:hypothetical protein
MQQQSEQKTVEQKPLTWDTVAQILKSPDGYSKLAPEQQKHLCEWVIANKRVRK